MNYSIIIESKSYDLPAYSFGIAEKIEKQEILNKSNAKFREKCKSMYDFLVEVLGKTTINDLLGEFNNVEPNLLNLTYLKVISAYNNPIKEYSNENALNSLSDDKLDKLINLLNAMNNLDKLKGQNR